ncbi:MAG: hypothetical protein WAN93_06930, partial [Solirubrobacteraceae bacterium]
MHRRFQDLLKNATGRSEFVLAANLDIRGFSDWSRRVESSQTILYLTKIYPKLIEAYFAEDWFFKPTGDGLLLVRPFVESELEQLVSVTARSCFEIVDVFGTLCQEEPMVNFEVPSAVGIGLAQGAASRLVANDGDKEVTLDYSGRVLNLASRLMELARPRGVVIDSGFGAGLLPEDVIARAEEATGYIRGVSPDDEVRILYDPMETRISSSFSSRPGEVQWRSAQITLTLQEMENYRLPHRFELDGELAVPQQIQCTFRHHALTASGHKAGGGRITVGAISEFAYFEHAGKPCVSVKI